MLDAEIPDAWDWRAVKMPDGSVKDLTCNQGDSQDGKGACTAYGSTGMCGNLELIAGTFPKGGLCKLWIYNDARNRGGLLKPVPQDGAYMIHVMQAAKEDGICREVLKPFDVNDLEFDSWPFGRQALMAEDAANFKIKDFGLVAPEGQESQWVDLQCRVIYFFGAVDMGTPWTSDWSQNLTGHMKVPNGSLDGGHSWPTHGYKVLERDANRKVTKALYFARNSWDAEWPLGTTTGDFDYPSETLTCAKWKQYGSMENYRAVTDETHVCPENEHWSFTDQKCVPDSDGPEPTDCYTQDLQCQAKAMQENTDFWALFWAKLGCLEGFLICALGLGKVRAMINTALGKKMSMTKKKTLKKIGISISVTVSKPKTAKW
jgi:hypothetical protein